MNSVAQKPRDVIVGLDIRQIYQTMDCSLRDFKMVDGFPYNRITELLSVTPVHNVSSFDHSEQYEHYRTSRLKEGGLVSEIHLVISLSLMITQPSKNGEIRLSKYFLSTWVRSQYLRRSSLPSLMDVGCSIWLIVKPLTPGYPNFYGLTKMWTWGSVCWKRLQTRGFGSNLWKQFTDQSFTLGGVSFF